MKKSKILKRIITMLAVISLVFPNLAGSGIQVANAATTNEDPVFKETSFRTILVGKSYDFDIKNKPSKATYQWKSSNKAVATVNNKGVVKALKTGSITVTCKITSEKSSITLNAKVYVKEPSKNPATKLKINNMIQSMAVGETYNLNCTYTPSKASDSVNWTSSDTSVAGVNANGVVTALKNGTVTIKATTVNKSCTDKITIKVSPEVVVSSQEQLNQALKAGKASIILISSKSALELTIPKGDYSGQELIVDAPNTAIHNYGIFKKITLRALKDQGWDEFAKGNTLQVYASTNITVEESADCAIIVDNSDIKLGLVLNGITKIDALKPCEINCDGTAKDLPKLNVGTTGVKINTKIALQIYASYQAVLKLETEAAAKSKVTAKDSNSIPKVEGIYRVNVEVNGIVQSVGADTSSNTGGQGGGSNPPATVTPTPIPGVVVDDKGFTPEGRIVANFGTPKIDGEIDEIWKKAYEIQPPHTSSEAVKATATFKVLWDDKALYVLAQVNDPNMTVAPYNAHEEDSIEIFLDEKNDKTSSYGSDDLQFRVNYENAQSVGNGDLNRFYTATKTGEGKYTIEARVELQNAAANDIIYGMDLQVNDGIGTSRAGTINVFDTTGSGWNNPSVFGEIVLTGKKPGDVPGLNPYKLNKLITSAEKLDVTYVLFTASLDAAKAVLNDNTSTQQDIDTAYDALNQVITFVNAVTKAAKIDLSLYQTEGAAAAKKAIEAAEKLLAKEGTTADEMKEAIAALDKAIAALKAKGLDPDGNMVAKFGSPVIDGDIDSVWDKVDFVPANASGSGSTDTTAKFKVLWDDKALYVLADVTDSVLDVTSGTVYNRDCVEIFLDEGNNALENIFDLDDTHYRISCKNSLSADRGSLDRLYTNVADKKDAEGKVTGYILEARIALQNPATNDKKYGIELQLNDAKGGNRTGTLNVFDKTSTAYASPTRLGKVVLSAKSAEDVIGFNQYDLLKLVNIANDIELVRYTDATAATVTGLVAQAEATIATGDQAQVDALYASLDQAIKALVHKDIKDVDPAITKIKEFRRIPAEYLTAAAYDTKGTVVRDSYDTYEYSDAGVRGNAVQKDMLVYLPAGYKAEDKNTKYNVLYLIHGTSENQNTVFGDDDVNVTTVMKKVLDMMIANGELDPMIVVCPTYRGMESGRLQYEMVNEIMPFIATKYNTYAASGSQDALKAARNHHAVGGFSQGSSCTFTIMKNCFGYFKYYLPISGGPGNADFTSVVKGYAMKDYYVFASTGTDDIAYGGMVNAIPAMANQKDSEGNPIFNYNADLSQGNLYLLLLKDGTHTWQCVNQYLYNILPDVFFAEKEPASPVIVTDENGFTADGKIVGKYGTPKVDGEIDEIWKNAIEIKPPHTNNAAVKATATFKVLWDDNALYVLAQVNDPYMTLDPSQAHEKDSIEIFLDENNDKTSSYGSDDLQFRVNYGNAQSGNGDLSRFYTKTKTGEGNYIVEARVELQNAAANDIIYGMDLQVNDGIGTSRAGTITVFDTTDRAWSNPSVFGEIVLTGKKPGDVPGLNPYKLIKLVASAEKMDATAVLFTESLDAAKAVLNDNTSTQQDIDTAYNALNQVITFVNTVAKAAKMDLSVYQTEGAAAVRKAVEDAEKLLAKEDTTADEMNKAIAALDKAITELKVNGLDPDGNMVAKFGSPVIDGDIDSVWNKVDFVPATASGSGSTDTTAKFKVLWDDKALYVLADVTDSTLDVTSGTVYNRDCVEIFLDEGNNALENIFDLDDTHYRISCKNSLSADRGSLDRLYTNVADKKDAEGKVTGYILEARIALQNLAKDNNIYGIELQLNDAKGGNRTGTLNVFDKTSTAYASPTRLGKVVLSAKSTGDVIGFNQYDLLKMVNIANDIELVRYTDATAATVTELVGQAATKIATGDQAQVDALYASLDQAIKALVHKDIKDVDPAITKLKEFRRIPAEYLTAAAYDTKGTVVRDSYDTYEYSDAGVRGNVVQKDMLVYLPAGYKAEDKNTKYNVLYLIHGTSEDQNTVFGDDDPNVTTVMKKVLDKMIANGELDPMIVVCPTYRGMESGRLQYEMVNEIMPFIATKYNTYAASGSQDALKAARNHHAVGGFSQGSSCTFTIMKNCFGYFKYYLPISGGPGNADFTSVVKGYAMKDYYVFASTGTDDIAYSGMVNAIPAMAEQKDSEGNPIFNYNADLSQGNLYLLLLPGGTHTWQCVNQYLYNILPDVFFAEKEPASPVIVTDENGFTADGKIVGKYGTPKVDGEIDEIWKNAIEIKPPHTNNAAVKATATFKVLWDDNALYVLAQVKDPNMTLDPSQAHEKDSIEIFLDENNDKTSSYGSDDLQFRVNYGNAQSAGSGNLSRFYTATWTGEGKYIIEARVELQNLAANNKIYGMELQVNDGIGSSRAGTITLFDTTDSAWRNPAVFGEIVLTGKKHGDVPGLNPYKLMALVKTAESLDVSGFTKGVGAFTARVATAKAAINTAATQAEMDAAYNALNDVMTFMGVIKKYAGLNLDAIRNGEAVKLAVAAAEDILAKAEATNEEMLQASSALDTAIAGIGSYSLKEVYKDKFLMGAAVHLNGLADAKYTENLLSQYNSITAENDMKPEALLDQAATVSGSAITVSGGAIICNFTQMDKYCDFAQANGLKMRGHTFVWHSQTPTWFFKEGFNADGAYVDVATMNSRLEQFINQVFGHIKDKYPDLFYAYDICNEVVSSMDMGSSNWYKVYGDYSFVTKAFEYARKASEGTGIKLYYNDYNEYDPGKAEKIIALLADAKAAGNIDGIGMQSHVNIEYPPMDQYRATIEKFVAAGYDVQITELDIATSINGNGPAPDSAMAAKQAQIYKELFQCYIDFKDQISSVTLWGINDQHSWRGSQEPLIFDREYKEKDSYWNIISVGLPGK